MAGAAGRLGGPGRIGGRRVPRGAASVAAAVLARPRLWRPALRQLRLLAPTGWWRRFPPVPAPDPDWMAFRTVTAYGDPAARLVPDDVLTWLAWSATVRQDPDRTGTRRG